MLKIREDRCKGCGLCVRACPLKLLKLDGDRINANGYHPACLTDRQACS